MKWRKWAKWMQWALYEVRSNPMDRRALCTRLSTTLFCMWI
jgi:hypothetical protein